MHVCVCWYSTVEIVSLCVAGGVIKHHMCALSLLCSVFDLFSISETVSLVIQFNARPYVHVL